MGQRYRRGLTAAQKTELWDRWQRGESLKAIGISVSPEPSRQASCRQFQNSMGTLLQRAVTHKKPWPGEEEVDRDQ